NPHTRRSNNRETAEANFARGPWRPGSVAHRHEWEEQNMERETENTSKRVLKKPKKPTPEQDAIAFMHSMLQLVDRRGLRYVDQEFGNPMTGMATSIVTPDDPTSNGGSKDAIRAGQVLIDEFPKPARHRPPSRC